MRLRQLVTFVCAALCVVAGLPSIAVAAQPLHGEIFVVDPGHGTRFPNGKPLNVGAVGPDGVTEENVVLAIGEDLARLLRAAGAEVVLTRSYAHPYRIGTGRKADNRARAALANRLGATAFIALHADADPYHRRWAHGTSVFWLRRNSVALAKSVRAHLKPLGLGESAFRARSLAVTRVARIPAVLVELGFVTNPRQEHLLAAPHFQRIEAYALYDAILAVFAH